MLRLRGLRRAPLVLAIAAAAPAPGAPQEPPPVPDAPLGLPALADRETPIVRVVRAVAPAVVNVSTTREVQIPRYEIFFGARRKQQLNQGSGVVIDSAGFVVTNEHVVRGAEHIRIRFDQAVDSREYRASLIEADGEADLALLKIDGEGPFPSIRLGHSDDLMIGETVVAIGNPFPNTIGGRSNTVTLGILSAVGREIVVDGRIHRDLLQTDAAINPGNSGGPLVNVRGEVIGINQAILSPAVAEGIGFAIPADHVTDILNTHLMNVGRSNRLWLGLTVEGEHDVRVASVESDGPAEAAGLAVGDHLLEVDGRPIGAPMEFSKAVLPHSAGDRVALRVSRAGEEWTTRLALGSRAEFTLRERLGIAVKEEERGDARWLRVERVLPGTPAARVQFRPGDIVWAVGVPVGRATATVRAVTVEQLVEVLAHVPPGQRIQVSLYRNEESYSGEVRLR